MSTVKSSSANLTLNADGSGNDIKFQSNAVEKGSLTDGGVWTGSTFEPTGDTAAGDNAAIGYTATEGLILTGQGSTDDVTIKNDADTTVLNVATGSSDIEVSAGDLIFGTAGKGICLGVTSNTDANTLDDYEEGTWTPATVTGTVTPTAAYYTKIGRIVHFSATLASFSDTTTVASVSISGLPFTIAAPMALGSAMGRYVDKNGGWSTTYGGGTTFYIYEMSDDSWRPLTHDLLDSGSTQFYVCGTYTVA